MVWFLSAAECIIADRSGRLKRNEIGVCEMVEISQWVMLLIWSMNIVFIGVVLFVEKKRPEIALCWLLALVFLPVVGFLLYLFFGLSLPLYQRWSVAGRQTDTGADTCREVPLNRTEDALMRMNERLGDGSLQTDNQVEVFVNGKAKYSALLADIQQAVSTIHLLYFIIRNDRFGRHLLQVLEEKAKQGVKVRLLYDHGGSFFTPDDLFCSLAEAGGEVRRFFPIRLGYYLRVNYRNHRKIVVIDGKIGYLGGMNIGEEYMGSDVANQIPWRDSHLRIEGGSVHDLAARFLADWRFAGGSIDEKEEMLFPPPVHTGKSAVQIVSSGPYQRASAIKWNYLRMLYGARESVWLQTPYFVPDESFLEGVRVAVASGVQVRILLSAHSDNRFVQKVSVSYAEELWKLGAEIAFYPGFLHSKMGIVDEWGVTLGTSNLDRRSFTLNFETNAILYDRTIVEKCRNFFSDDWARSRKMKEGADWARSPLSRCEEAVWRLFAPLL